ncbi:unnamed protein product [Absidia cylindrospora]
MFGKTSFSGGQQEEQHPTSFSDGSQLKEGFSATCSGGLEIPATSTSNTGETAAVTNSITFGQSHFHLLMLGLPHLGILLLDSATNTQEATGNFGNHSGFGSTTNTFNQQQQQQQQQLLASNQSTGTTNHQFATTPDMNLTDQMTWYFQSITAMPCYKYYSFEELRLQDYQQHQKPPTTSGTGFDTVTGGFDPVPAPDFVPTSEIDPNYGSSVNFQTITSMPHYLHLSVEELRLRDYMDNRKPPATSSTTCYGAAQPSLPFGQPASGFAPTNQQPPSTQFGAGNRTSFGGATKQIRSVFDQQQQQTNSDFGQQPITAFGQQSTTTFDQQPVPNAFSNRQLNNTANTFSFANAATTSKAFQGYGGFGQANQQQQQQQQQPTVCNCGRTSIGADSATSGFGRANTSSTNFSGFGGTTSGFGQTQYAATGFGVAPQTSTGYGSFGGNSSGANVVFGQTQTPQMGFNGGFSGSRPSTGQASSFFSTPQLQHHQQSTTGFGGFGTSAQSPTTVTISFDLELDSVMHGQELNVTATINGVPHSNNRIFYTGTLQQQHQQQQHTFVSAKPVSQGAPHKSISESRARTAKQRSYQTTTLHSGTCTSHSTDQQLNFNNMNTNNVITDAESTQGDQEYNAVSAFRDGSDAFSADYRARATTTTGTISPTSQQQQQRESDHESYTDTANESSIANTAETDIEVAIDEGYYCIPSLDTLRRKTPEELKQVEGFVVGRHGVGKVTFDEPVNICDVELNDILGSIVVLDHKRVTIYPENCNSPTMGDGLNVPATVELKNCYTYDKVTKQPIRDPSHPRFALFLEKLRCRQGTTFVNYVAATGSWVFKANRF